MGSKSIKLLNVATPSVICKNHRDVNQRHENLYNKFMTRVISTAKCSNVSKTSITILVNTSIKIKNILYIFVGFFLNMYQGSHFEVVLHNKCNQISFPSSVIPKL